MTNIAQMINKWERQATHDGRAPQRMNHVLPILVRGGTFLTLLFFTVVQVFRIDGGSLIMPISFAIGCTVGVLLAVLAWQPHDLRRRILAVVIGCVVMVMIVVCAWQYTVSLLDVRLPPSPG